MMSEPRMIQAIPVSPGIAIGGVMRLHHELPAEPPKHLISPEEVPNELRRFENARNATRKQITELRSSVQNTLQQVSNAIFDAHLLLVDDKLLIREVEKLIREGYCCAEFAITEASEHFAQAFAGIADEYLQERAADLRDVAARLLRNLSETPEEVRKYDDRRIVIATNLTPSDTAGLNHERVLGFAVETGSVTSHAAILARSLKLPAVVGVPLEVLDSLTAADKLIVDGFSGKVFINPDARTEEAYRLKDKECGKFYSELMRESARTPETTDGCIIPLAVNLDSQNGYGEAREAGAAGVGLFRTEFLFMSPGHLPGEEEQYQVYKDILIAADHAPVTIRTLDIGGDKLSTNIARAVEQNPFLGLRGIRLCLHEHPDLFRTQLRALLRAGVHGDLRVMLPMVSSIHEVRKTQDLIRELREELQKEKIPCVSRLPLGIMIETPAAALIAERFASCVDFFSIGTNDLVQYTMAVDRSNERVAHLYRPAHPAILRLIRMTMEAARKHNIYVSVCGQTAEMPVMIPLLIGLGVHELSMSAGAIPLVRRLIRSVSYCECSELAEQALQCDCAAAAVKLSQELLTRRVPELASLFPNSKRS